MIFLIFRIFLIKLVFLINVNASLMRSILIINLYVKSLE